MKIAIIGSGAMGSLVGAKISDNSEVLLFDHWTSHVDEINSNGLKLISNNEEIVYKNLRASSNYNDLKGYDIYLILVKGTNTNKELEILKDIVSDSSLVITLQNGLGNHDVIANYIKKDNIAYGMMDFNARLVKEALVDYNISTRKISLTMYQDNNDNKMFKEFNKILKQSGFIVEVNNAKKDIWQKLIINANFNAVSGITGLKIGKLINDENFDKIIRGITSEIVEIANKKNIDLSLEDEINNVYERSKTAMEHYPSLAQDASRRLKTEIDFLNGAIIKEGIKEGVKTPYNNTVYSLFKIIENNYEDGKLFNINNKK